MNIRTIWGFAKLFLSNPAVTFKLLNMRRVMNGMRLLVTHPRDLDQLFRRYNTIYLSDPSERVTELPPAADQLPDILFFPVIDWHFRFQRPQQLASELAKAGHRVFYLATTPLIAAPGERFVIQESPAPNVFVVQLNSGQTRLPDFYRDSFTDIEIAGISAALKSLIDFAGGHATMAIAQHPVWLPVIEAGTWKSVLYDCLDHHAGFLDDVPPALLTMERRMIQRADVITVSSEKLRQDIAPYKACTIIRNGCEYQKFSAAPRQKRQRPTLGYVGAIASWFDDKMVAEIAALRPQWDIVLVGSTVGAQVANLKAQANVSFVGEVEYRQVPQYMASFDVCLIPFKIIPLTEATNPVKVYEYLATGRPVVATDLPELRGMEAQDVLLATGAAQFISQVESVLQLADNPERVAHRKQWAQGYDWSARARQMMGLIAP